MSWRPIRLGSILAATCALGAAARAQADTLVVGAQFSAAEPNATGRGASVDWVSRTRSGRIVSLGFATFSIDASRWTYAKVGAAWSVAARTFASVSADAGGGRTGPTSFGYLIVRGALTRARHDGRVAVDAEGQYVRVHESRGLVVRLGAALAATPSLRVAAGAITSSASLGVTAVNGRVDRYIGRGAVFGGGALGKSSAALQAVGVDARSLTMREIFAGATVPAGPLAFTVVGGKLDLGGAVRRSISASVKLPL